MENFKKETAELIENEPKCDCHPASPLDLFIFNAETFVNQSLKIVQKIENGADMMENHEKIPQLYNYYRDLDKASPGGRFYLPMRAKSAGDSFLMHVSDVNSEISMAIYTKQVDTLKQKIDILQGNVNNNRFNLSF